MIRIPTLALRFSARCRRRVAIVIRSGQWIGKGDVVYEAEGAMECGGLRSSAPASAVKKKK